ncbi:MAG: glycine zipper 2TM domain-containing protein [Bdellovibrionaceae bacterium]|nr:glycine zipper 2TM domain-containing protein [Pseudobdellovibrionaceae bacterium]
MKKGILTVLALNAALLTPNSGYAQSTEELLGAILGGVGGAAVCSQFGKGDGRVVLTAACAIGGALLGSEIGRSLSRQDQEAYRRSMNESMGDPVGRRRDWRGDKHSGHCEVVRTGYLRQRTTVQCREIRSVVTDAFGRVIATQVETSCYSESRWVRVEDREVIFASNDRRDDRREDRRDDRRDDGYDRRDDRGGYDRRGEDRRDDRGGYDRRGEDRRDDRGGYDRRDDDRYGRRDDDRYGRRDQDRGGYQQQGAQISNYDLNNYVQAMQNHYADAARLGVVYDLRDYLRANRMTLNDRQLNRILNQLETRSGRQEALSLLSDRLR